MFNPYAVRPIGSERFFEHLKDVQTEQYYNLKPEDEQDIVLTGWFPWKHYDKHLLDGADELVIAVAAMAFIDYLEAYREKLIIENMKGRNGAYWFYNSRCLVLENEYFRKSLFLNDCFDKLLENICWEGISEIDKCIVRMKSLLRWVNTPNTKLKEQKGDKNGREK